MTYRAAPDVFAMIQRRMNRNRNRLQSTISISMDDLASCSHLLKPTALMTM